MTHSNLKANLGLNGWKIKVLDLIDSNSWNYTYVISRHKFKGLFIY